MRATSRVSRISSPSGQYPAAIRKSTSSFAPCPTGRRSRTNSASSLRTAPGDLAPTRSAGSMPVRRSTASGTERPGSASRSRVEVTASRVKATAPTSITRSRLASSPVVSRSSATYSMRPGDSMGGLRREGSPAAREGEFVSGGLHDAVQAVAQGSEVGVGASHGLGQLLGDRQHDRVRRLLVAHLAAVRPPLADPERLPEPELDRDPPGPVRALRKAVTGPNQRDRLNDHSGRPGQETDHRLGHSKAPLGNQESLRRHDQRTTPPKDLERRPEGGEA